MRIQDRLYNNGEWVSSHACGVFEVVNASTEEVMANVPAGGSESVHRAGRAASPEA